MNFIMRWSLDTFLYLVHAIHNSTTRWRLHPFLSAPSPCTTPVLTEAQLQSSRLFPQTRTAYRPIATSLRQHHVSLAPCLRVQLDRSYVLYIRPNRTHIETCSDLVRSARLHNNAFAPSRRISNGDRLQVSAVRSLDLNAAQICAFCGSSVGRFSRYTYGAAS